MEYLKKYVTGDFNSLELDSLKTKKVEIIGLSLDKKKTIKIKGFLKGE